jgi:hypothetical protein
MLGGIVALLVAIWFYRSAEGRGLPSVPWAIAGVIAYYVPNFIWSLLVAKPWLTTLHAQNAPAMSSLVGHSSIFVGLLFAVVARQFALLRAKPQP